MAYNDLTIVTCNYYNSLTSSEASGFLVCENIVCKHVDNNMFTISPKK